MEMFVRFTKTCFSIFSTPPDHNSLLIRSSGLEQMSMRSFQKFTKLEDLDTKEDEVEVSNNEAPANEAEEPSPNKSKSKKKQGRKGSKHSKQLKVKAKTKTMPVSLPNVPRPT